MRWMPAVATAVRGAETEVWRSTNGLNSTLLATKSAGVTSHLDEGLTTGSTYWYKVRYKMGTEVSGWSNTLSQDAGGIDPESGGNKSGS